MAEHTKYHLRVSAGPSYDESQHKLVHVNTSSPMTITSSHITSTVSVRIQNYRGLPQDSPSTSPYFTHSPHTSDLYSLAFSFTLKDADIPGDALLFGNDFAQPIRDRLPPGFSTALRIVRWTVDPGLQGDVYADRPYLYGPLLSSINVLRVGEKNDGAGGAEHDGAAAEPKDEGDAVVPLTEGGTGTGLHERETHHVPAEAAKRMKFFLDEHKRKEWMFEKGREYSCDFFNPYLDFNELALKLPGFTLGIMKYWDGQPLRYVLKHKDEAKGIDEPLLVIVLTLIPEEELEAEEKKWGKTAEPAATEKGDDAAAAPTATDPEAKKFVDEDID